MSNPGKIKTLLIQGKSEDEIFQQIKQESNLIRQDQMNALRSFISLTKKEHEKDIKNEHTDDATVIKNLQIRVIQNENDIEKLKGYIEFLIRYYPLMESVTLMESEDIAPVIDKYVLVNMKNKLSEIKDIIKKV